MFRRPKQRLRSLVGLALLTGLVAACSVSVDTSLAEHEVQHFHELLGSSAIYEAAAEELKKVSPQAEFVALLDAVHRKLGRSGTPRAKPRSNSSIASRTRKHSWPATTSIPPLLS
jgi:hypothetical protein